jgi:hypothetical protein
MFESREKWWNWVQNIRCEVSGYRHTCTCKC